MAASNKRFSIPLQVGGMFSAGDPGAIPDGTVKSLSNILPQPNRLQVRPPFVYDTLMAINGLANFDDQTNKVTRLVAVDATAHVYTKATSGETWGAANGTTISGTRVTDFANYRGKVYAMVDNGSGLPSAAFSYDGTTITTSPFNTGIAARTVTAFNDRLFLGYPRVTFTANNNADAGYNFTNGAAYSTSGLTVSNFTVSGGTVCRAYLTSTTAAALSWTKSPAGNHVGLGSYAASSAKQYGVARWDIRTLDPLNALPVRMRVRAFSQWVSGATFAAGDIISDAFRLQRCTTGGTSGGGAPAWATTVGATTADNTVTWTCEGTNDNYGVTETTIPAATTALEFTTVVVPFAIPQATNTQLVSVELDFFNTASPTITLTAVDLSFKDALADGDARKANKGLQVTPGDFYYPFYNQESSTTATVDMQQIVWSEIGIPASIRAANTYNPWESPGYITAACSIGGRYRTFKRRAFWVFQGTSDPDNPIVRESYDDACGCLGPRAIDTMENTAYFIGENEVYSLNGGNAPTPLCGEGMREEILNKASAGWVESQSTYKRPLLVIDKTKLLVWVYTQKAILYCYDIRNRIWSKHTTPNSVEVDAMCYNPNTGEVYVAYASATYGLSRLDFTAAAQNDTIDNSVNTYSVSADIIFKPLELYQPPRYDATLEEIRFLHAATASQSSQTVTAYYSTDQGTTYPKNEQVTLSPLSASGEFLPVRLNALQTAPTVTLKLNHTGKAGATAWTISPRVYASINVRRGEYPTSNQTGGSATL